MSKKKKTLRRSFDFEIPLYEKLQADASANARTFPAHVVRILEEYIEKGVEK